MSITSPCLSKNNRFNSGKFNKSIGGEGETDAVIIAGGLGTRSQNPKIAKSMQLVNDEPLLGYQLRQLSIDKVKNIIVVGGHRIQEISKYLENHSIQTNVILVNDVEQKGTLNALRMGAKFSQAENIAVVFGDIFFDLSLEMYLDEFINSHKESYFLAHPNLHPSDSDLFKVETRSGSVKFIGKKRNPKMDDGNLASSGIFFVKREKIFSEATSQFDDCAGLTEYLVGTGNCEIRVTTDYIADTGTPSRLESVNNAFKSGFVRARSRSGKKAAFVDLDNTLIRNVEKKNTLFQENIHPQIVESITLLNRMGIPVIVISNQPGVAKGFFSFEEFDSFILSLQTQLARNLCFVDDWFVCFHHPETGWPNEVPQLKSNCEFRKPNSGLIEYASNLHRISKDESIFLGDSVNDSGAAMNCGIKFNLVVADELKYKANQKALSEALREWINS